MNMSDFSRFDDIDPTETREWLESIDSVLSQHGPERAHYLLNQMIDFARRSGAYLPYSPNTAYLNTIATGKQPEYPGDRSIERRIEAYIRWNAMAMVVQANRVSTEYGGHISSYASSATLYEVGFNHFWRAASDDHGGDLVFFQGHSSPGIYSRAYLEGRLNEDHLNRFIDLGLRRLAEIIAVLRGIFDQQAQRFQDGLGPGRQGLAQGSRLNPGIGG